MVTGRPAAGPRAGRRPRVVATAVLALGALAAFLVGWQLAWRGGPYAAACFSIAAVAGLAAALSLAAAVRVHRSRVGRAGLPGGADGTSGSAAEPGGR